MQKTILALVAATGLAVFSVGALVPSAQSISSSQAQSTSSSASSSTQASTVTLVDAPFTQDNQHDDVGCVDKRI
ncbi:MAG: hypothetical protein LBI11_00015 [Streptococcaceae bacterium]|jgi:hypothetical protein|nr:hypothetical protein [Streptococcaceae bacterium]